MGFCMSCVSRGPTESKIKEIWENTLLTHLTPEEYLLRIVDFSKADNFVEAESQEPFYDSLFKSKDFSKFFEYLNQDIMFLVNNKNFQFQILSCFIFLTKYENAQHLKNNFAQLTNHIAEKFQIDLPLEDNVELFKEIFHAYIIIVSKFSADAVLKICPELSDNSDGKNDKEMMTNKAYEPGNIMTFINSLFNAKEFSVTKFIENNFNYLNHNNIRDELLVISMKSKFNIFGGKSEENKLEAYAEAEMETGVGPEANAKQQPEEHLEGKSKEQPEGEKAHD